MDDFVVMEKLYGQKDITCHNSSVASPNATARLRACISIEIHAAELGHEIDGTGVLKRRMDLDC
ncbi:hypothetical protein HDU67_007097, partial [Dinochytrium kinnereticum]